MDTGRYRIARLLQRGRVAEVLEAFVLDESGVERRVVLHRLLSDSAREEAFVAAFLDEARLVSRLDHPNIARVLDFGMFDDRPCLATEYVDGLDLTALESAAGDLGIEMPVEIALAITAEVANALEYAHTARDASGRSIRVVHRDVRPENILISWDGHIKLTGFDIARAKTHFEATVVLAKSSLQSTQPEHDVFALAVALHQILTGKSPLAPNAIDGSLPDDLKRIIARATGDARATRFAAKEMALECTAALTKRNKTDPRTAIEAWMAQFRHTGTVFVPETKALDRDHAATRVTELVSRAAESDPRIGTTIEGYRIGGLLGGGSSARVYRATHPALSSPCAIKILDPARATEMALSRLRREAGLAGAISHPNLVRVFDAGNTAGGVAFLVMELVEGRTLADVIRASGALPPEHAARIALQIAGGLAAAHQSGLVHRDLKPANVIVSTSNGRELVKIVDFGVARALKSSAAPAFTKLTKSGVMLGTPSYMAPEQIASPKSAGPSADLYALGVIMFEMLTGRRPFEGHLFEVLEGHLRKPPPDLAEHQGLDAIVRTLLDKSPARRYRDARAVGDAISQLGIVTIDLLPVPDTVVAASATRASMPAATRRASPWLVASLLAASAAAVLAVFASNRPAAVQLVEPAAPTAIAVQRGAEARAVAVPRDLSPTRSATASDARRGHPRKTAAKPAPERAGERAVEAEVEAPVAALVTAESVVAKLKGVSDLIAGSAGRLPAPELDAFESRYFDLRSRAKASLTSEEAEGLLKETEKLERQIRTRLANGS